MPELTSSFAVAAQSRLPLKARPVKRTVPGRDCPVACLVTVLRGSQHHVVVVEHRPRLRNVLAIAQHIKPAARTMLVIDA